MKRLGVARVIQKADYTPDKVTRKLRKIIDDPEIAEKARAVAVQMKGENGVKTACDALEELYARSTSLVP
jgi:rhamnosyltransferase subunit B